MYEKKHTWGGKKAAFQRDARVGQLLISKNPSGKERWALLSLKLLKVFLPFRGAVHIQGGKGGASEERRRSRKLNQKRSGNLLLKVYEWCSLRTIARTLYFSWKRIGGSKQPKRYNEEGRDDRSLFFGHGRSRYLLFPEDWKFYPGGEGRRSERGRASTNLLSWGLVYRIDRTRVVSGVTPDYLGKGEMRTGTHLTTATTQLGIYIFSKLEAAPNAQGGG